VLFSYPKDFTGLTTDLDEVVGITSEFDGVSK